MSGFNFNAESFIAGLGVGWGTAFAVYQSRHRLNRIRRAFQGVSEDEGTLVDRGADGGYLSELVKYIQADHLAGEGVSLSEILIEPRFVPPPKLAAPKEEGIVESVFSVVPIIPDLPYLHAPYNIETLAMEELDNGDRAVAILGEPGSGRTTALHAIALWSLGRVAFPPPSDKVQQQLEEEEAGLEDEERAQRYKERAQVEEMALQSLARKQDDDAEVQTQQRHGGTLLKRLLPIYIHLGNVILESGEYGGEIDPAEPLIRAAQQHIKSRTTRKTMVRPLYRRLEDGQVMLLIDGFDEIPAKERTAVRQWLRVLLEQYPSLFVMVTGSVMGYGSLVEAGFAPVFLRSWNDVMANRLVDLWSEHWPQISGKRRGDPPTSEIIEIARKRLRSRTPFDLTIKTWAIFEDPEQTDYDGWMRRLLAKHLPDEPLDEMMPQLIELVALQLNEGYITPARLQEAAQGIRASGMRKPSTGMLRDSADDLLADIDRLREPENPFEATETTTDDDLDALFGDDDDLDDEETRAEVSAETEAETETEDVIEAEADDVPASKEEKEYARLLNTLEKSGLLVRYRGGRYRFLHRFVADYIGAAALRTLDNDALLERAYETQWNGAFTLAAIHTDLTEVVNMRLEAPADVLHNTLFEMARWLAYAPLQVEWRAAILRHLGNMLVAPNQFRLVRERAAAALVTSRDRNALKVFTKALRHPNPDVRRVSTLGMGALRAENILGEISARLDDPDQNVMLAAGLALGAVGTDEALEEMVTALTSSNERLQQAIAEAFAAIPEEGYPVLYDAVNHEDMSLRRAAVFGLRRVNTPWALIAIYRRSLEDDQWYVRSAAELAFSGMNFGDTATGPQQYPKIESIDWLRQWVNTLSDAAQQTTHPDEFLRKALAEGDIEVQSLAARNIGQLGIVRDVGLLYTTIRHRDSTVREASHHALGELQTRIGQPLPAPVQ
jgi:HEAT repeat protein